MNINKTYQYIKLLLGVVIISVTLFASGCNQYLLQDDDVVEQPAAENNGASGTNPQNCRKTRGFVVHGHENQEQNCQQP